MNKKQYLNEVRTREIEDEILEIKSNLNDFVDESETSYSDYLEEDTEFNQALF